MHRQTAHAILNKAFIAAGLNGKLATHILRKSFAQRLYDKRHKMYNSLKNTDDQTLILELARRGYDISRRRDNETTAEIVKIG